MNKERHLRIVIGMDGSCSVDAINFTGPSCRTATMEVASALGVQIGHHDKPEVRMRERSGQSDREQAR